MSEEKGFLDRFIAFSIRRKWAICGAATVLFAVSLHFAFKLDLKADLLELLPTDSPSVVNLERMKQRIASYTTLTVAIESPDLDASMRFVDDLVARLKTFPPEQIKFVDHNLSDLRDFFARNKWLYADLQDLTDFRDRLDRRIREETEAAVVESLDDAPPPKTDLKIDELKAKYDKKTAAQDKFPKGYYVTPDRTITAVFVRPPPSAANFAASSKLVADIQAEVDRLVPAKYHPQMTVGFTGDVKTGLEERDALADDMEFISILALLGILAVIVAYYRSLSSVVIVGLPMLLGVALSFAVAYFAIGYLNSATAFLSSIIAGNGINFMIMLFARFHEELGAIGRGNLAQAMKVAVRDSMRGTAVASLAASIAYGSLMIAGFRGFRQFGIIGGAGMILCWLATFVTGPALIAAVDRIRPIGAPKSHSHFVADAVGRFVTRRPRAILAVSLLLTAASIVVTIPYAFDPFEYDFHNLRNREGVERGSAKLSNRVSTMFGVELDTPTPIITERASDVPRIKKAIMESTGAVAVVGDAQTLFDFLPKDQAEKLAVLSDIRRLVDRKLDFLDPDDRKTVLEYRPPETLRELTLDDVPEVVARPYTEQDGTRGRIIYVYAHIDESLLNGKYLLKLSKYLRGIQVEGAPITIIGQPMLFADMITSIVHDGVRVTIASSVAVLLLVIAAFRRRLGVFAVLMPVIMGTLWMIGFAAALDMKLNFLNFVVIPITLGIAVDYGANIYSRYRIEPPGRVGSIIASTGGAVMLASLTTIIGYATLITSTNMALQSFGIVADIGEVTCLGAAELVMTAFLVWWERSRASGAKAG